MLNPENVRFLWGNSTHGFAVCAARQYDMRGQGFLVLGQRPDMQVMERRHAGAQPERLSADHLGPVRPEPLPAEY